tara:strand:- start:35174 stop:35521 length:348 start_codon:yes stop_codon:yes gene_type:complete
MAEHNGHDLATQGGDTLAIKEHKGQVILQFPNPVSWVVLDAETARQAGEALARSAYKAHYGIEPQTGKSIFTEQKREVLVRRIELMLIGFIPKVPAMTPETMAVAITDTLLAEVL